MTIRHRIDAGWSIEKTLSVPAGSGKTRTMDYGKSMQAVEERLYLLESRVMELERILEAMEKSEKSDS